MSIVAFLQNQWFKNPERIRAIYAKHPAKRAYLNKSFLFMGCMSGRRLKKAFGELCDIIVWEEVSTEIGDRSSSVFPHDIKHMNAVIAEHRPEIILAFGQVAQRAMKDVKFTDGTVIMLPHPAARGRGVQEQLDSAASTLRELI